MVHAHKTPSQHNLTLYILPHIAGRRLDVFHTPPNPANSLFGTPGTDGLLFLNVPRASGGLRREKYTEEPLTRAEKLRLWRHDALMQHHYKTAEYIGDKVLALTGDANDAFWLAQVHFNSGNYLRARQLVGRPEYEKLVSCRYLTAYCLIKLELWDDALDVVGETNPFHKDDNYQVRNADGGIKLEASMCYLRGLIYANQNNLEKARDAYKEAVLVDVKCFEAFNELVANDLLTPAEQWAFIDTLNYRDADDNDELIRLLYTLRLSKYMQVARFVDADAVLLDEYRLGDNADLLLSRADYLYVQCNFDQCLAVCERIMARDPCNLHLIPNYLSCLYELGGKNKLFLKAHQLAENHPTSPVTWLAIGIYYLAIGKTLDARKFFSKATMLSPNFGHAWIGFAHTFASEGEHEQAISAYAFAARLFPGTHLPNLFLGMQHLQMNNLNLAEEYLLASYNICNSDPLLLNELGVICFHKNALEKAEAYFQEALAAARHLNSDSKTWISIHANLGHVYRRANLPYKALDCFNQVLKISSKNDSNVLSAMGLVHLKLGNHIDAIDVLHDALAILPSDPVALDLLKRALEANKNSGALFNAFSDDRLREMSLHFRRPPQGGVLHQLAAVTAASSKLGTPLHGKTRLRRDQLAAPVVGDDPGQDMEIVADQLRRGDDSSDDDGEIMDLESD